MTSRVTTRATGLAVACAVASTFIAGLGCVASHAGGPLDGRAVASPTASPSAAAATRPAVGAPRDLVTPPLQGRRVPGVANFGVASPDVWRGARPTPEGLRNLAALGVKTVIDLQESDGSADVPPGVRYVPRRVSQWTCDRVDTAAVLRAIADNPKPVFIHCREGRDRTGLAVGAYQLSRGVPVDEALAELDRYGVHFWWRGPIAARLRALAGAAGKTAAAAPGSSPPAKGG
jgi:protein tyrosine phosphatase (PTP) superfamily phosphohydrolase (DUF442 family)